MTREEADRELMYLKSKTRQEDTLEAIEMARALLMSEPCEDCISRETVIDELKWIEEYGMLDMKRALKLITDLPSVTPAMERGSWVPVDDEPHEDYECDRCGRIVYCEGDVDFEFKYCPECGAEMWGGESE